VNKYDKIFEKSVLLDCNFDLKLLNEISLKV